MKMAVLWSIVPSSLVEVYEHLLPKSSRHNISEDNSLGGGGNRFWIFMLLTSTVDYSKSGETVASGTILCNI